MSDRTPFEARIERLIVDHTDGMLRAIDRLASEMGVEAGVVDRAVDRFGGGDLADCWFEFLAEEGE